MVLRTLAFCGNWAAGAPLPPIGAFTLGWPGGSGWAAAETEKAAKANNIAKDFMDMLLS